MSTEFAVGDVVALKGLVGSPEKNGERGALKSFNTDTGRWQVLLQSGQCVNVKPENMNVELKQAKESASYKPLVTAPTTASLGSYYGTDPDSYKKARVVRPGEVKSTHFDHELYKSMAKSLTDDGKVSVAELDSMIWPEIADGRGGRKELTCNERWTIRYGLGEFNWQFDARLKLMQSLPTIDVMSLDDKKVTDEGAVNRLLKGPTLDELSEPPPKRARVEPEEDIDSIWVDGMNLNRSMLKAAKEAVGDDQVIDAYEAVKLFHAAADGGEMTCCKRWTLRFILSAYVFTDAAFDFIKEALAERPGKIKFTDWLDA